MTLEDNCYHCACFKIFTFLSYYLIFKLFSENEVFIFLKITHLEIQNNGHKAAYGHLNFVCVSEFPIVVA